MIATPRSAIVTGATSPNGLGYGIAKRLAAAGYAVMMTGSREAEITARASELRSQGHRALGLRADVRIDADWLHLFEAAEAELGPVALLVNNAGITIRNSVENFTDQDWDEVLDINLTGMFLGARRALQVMRRNLIGGCIVNISSIGALRGFPRSIAYGASKSAIRALTRQISAEGREAGIRCHTVFPGVIRTDIHARVRQDAPEQHERLVSTIPLRRLGDPAEIGAAVLFLASDDISALANLEVTVDGGLTVC